MAISKKMISEWFQRELNFDYMLVICDTFDYDYFPVYCLKTELQSKINHYKNKSMAKIMEIYSYNENFETQLKKDRCFSLPKDVII